MTLTAWLGYSVSYDRRHGCWVGWRSRHVGGEAVDPVCVSTAMTQAAAENGCKRDANRYAEREFARVVDFKRTDEGKGESVITAELLLPTTTPYTGRA